MNRVTIRQLLYECTQPMSPDDYVKMQKILDTEITPRRAIEMIIERCEQTINNVCYSEENMRVWEARDIKEYAEALLEQFEDDFSNTEKCLVEPLPFD